MMNWLAHTSANPDETLHINVPTLDALLSDLGQKLSKGQGFSVATLNLDHVVKLRDQPEFRTAYRAHSHITADGNPIVWCSRLAGDQVSLVAGSDLLVPVIELAVSAGAKIALFGSTPASLERTTQALQKTYPDIRICAQIAPAMGFDPDGADAAAHIETLKAAGAQLCLIALGAPKQEKFAARAQTLAPEMGFLSIGAGLDFISGHQRRAPKIVRMLAIEWLWRLMLSPARLMGRYAQCIVILPKLFVIALNVRWSAGRSE